MTSTQTTLIMIYAAIIAIWPIRLFVLELILRRQRMLTSESARYDQPEFPLVSAIIPAKDEETNLEECARSVAGLNYPHLEILIVNDRSTDRTEEIARRLAAGDERIKVITIDELPSGWTGKTHALDRGAESAHGQWLLFVDADTNHAPESLSIVMEVARSYQAALVTLLPELRCETFWEQVVQPLAAITLMQSFPLHSVHDPRSRLAFANGQYILIERSAYDAVGGHRSVRDRFVEDIALARRVKSIGLPIRVALVRGIVSCRMYSSLGQLERGWSRILYAALDRKLWRLVAKLLDPIVFCQTGHVAFLASLVLLVLGRGGNFAVSLLAMSVIHHMLMYAVFHRVYSVSVPRSRFVAWFPVANLVIDAILLRAIGMCVTGKVSWRGTDYPAARSSEAASGSPVDADERTRPDSQRRTNERDGAVPAARDS
jgi:glycosyltransferase involved in cell wall biosynthesis